MRRRDLERLADPTPTGAEVVDELDRVDRMLREIAGDQGPRARWRRRRLLAWRDRLYAELPEPRRPAELPTRPEEASPSSRSRRHRRTSSG